MEEKRKEEIRKEARAILDKFAKTLEKVGDIKVGVEKKDNKDMGMRQEGEGQVGDEDFRKRMFENAPRKDRDCIVAEKGSW